ncbi:RNA polymerase sigma-70 factor (ECF subfamily) [Sediminihabitans luteus]|uniref:RNA polymerase sigma-70 factor (ECF subfamily) n=1 Tax=Sediminihabitans luteus TaxID=1138585 RepID=A0A2M9D0Z5_9CELL|nr:sigma-70 family RNA polymerase sigma factor [Sediminihabitans luteus]PJJ77797.1 RNA polymerase sigma-70 factor (ECF subfamily) [Sediminihabitans luteus]GII99845.1 DNA-directed RNA polymerase sigma-70 factor [Sediminihabitans luteus]
MTETIAAGTAVTTRDDLPTLDGLGDALDAYRRELTGYCYRMLGSSFEADDAVQDTFVRAWRSYERFEGRSSLRSWLYRIATNVCFDALAGRQRRERPVDMTAARTAELENLGDVLPEDRFVQPVADDSVLPLDGDPADVAVGRESIRLAFVAAIQHLPPKQRAVLILREVLRWRADEVATLLDTTVASVNSALQRARATLAARTRWSSGAPSAVEAALLARYVDAFERYDMDALVALLHEDATLSMPPYDLWLRGAPEVVRWMVGPGHGCRGSRLVPVAANGSVAFGQYRPSPTGGHDAWALQVLDLDADGRVTGIVAFLEVGTHFPRFGLPLHLDA